MAPYQPYLQLAKPGLHRRACVAVFPERLLAERCCAARNRFETVRRRTVGTPSRGLRAEYPASVRVGVTASVLLYEAASPSLCRRRAVARSSTRMAFAHSATGRAAEGSPVAIAASRRMRASA